MKHKHVAVLSQHELETNCLPNLFQWIAGKQLSVSDQRKLKQDRANVLNMNRVAQWFERFLTLQQDVELCLMQTYYHAYCISQVGLPLPQLMTAVLPSDSDVLYTKLRALLNERKLLKEHVVFNVEVVKKNSGDLNMGSDASDRVAHVFGLKSTFDGVRFYEQQSLFDYEEQTSETVVDAWDDFAKTAITGYIHQRGVLYTLSVVFYNDDKSGLA